MQFLSILDAVCTTESQQNVRPSRWKVLLNRDQKLQRRILSTKSSRASVGIGWRQSPCFDGRELHISSVGKDANSCTFEFWIDRTGDGLPVIGKDFDDPFVIFRSFLSSLSYSNWYKNGRAPQQVNLY